MPDLESRLKADPISLPENPFLDVLKSFGRDEVLAMFLGAGVTCLANGFITDPISLSLAGPIGEKIGFFPGHLYKAKKEFKETPLPLRKELSYYVRRAFANGFANMAKDIIFHDPAYVSMMYFGQLQYPDIPVWMLSAFSFAISVAGISIGEVAIKEMLHWNKKRELKNKGFALDNFYEARFNIFDKDAALKLTQDLCDEFGLSKKITERYNDIYYETNLPEYNGRTVKLRLRNQDGNTTTQITYQKASESKESLSQHRYFLARKERLVYDRVLDDLLGEKKGELCVERVLCSSNYLMVSLDHVNNEFHVIEIKSEDLNLMKQAMNYVMHHYPVTLTTRCKFDQHVLTKHTS